MTLFRPTVRLLFLLAWLGLLTACRSDAQSAASPGNFSTHQLKIEVAADGMVQLALADLQAAGLAVTALDSSQLSLSQAGTAVPYTLSDDRLIFYGKAPDSRYTAVRPYILEVGQAGQVMGETAVSPASANTTPSTTLSQQRHLEENLLYLSQAYQDEASDVWYWQELSQEEKIELTIELAAVADSPAALRLQLLGKTSNPEVNPDHDFDLVVNGQSIMTIQWDGEALYTAEAALPAGLLRPGANKVVLDNELPGASFLDIMVLNWLELSYAAPATAVNDRIHFTQTEAAAVNLAGFSSQPLIFDISQSNDPTQLTGWLYEGGQAQLTAPAGEIIAVGARGFMPATAVTPLRQSDWHNSQNQADLIIITTDELAPALAPLVEARQNQGLTVATVPAAEIYDEFGNGAASPESIRNFVTYAAQNWQKPPTYLFLVGDATTDYHNYQGHAPHNQVPSLLVPVQFSGETVSDSRLADVDGDMKPDMAIGRWPVDSVDAVEDLVARTLAYEGGTAVSQTLFAADGTEAQFTAIAERLGSESGLASSAMTVLTGPQAGEVVAAWNDGAWLTTYVGHGSVERWGKEDLFFPAAVADLSPATPPIVLQLTCLSGLFAHPELQSLSETLLLDEHGPVLLIGATSLTYSSNQEQFALSFLQNLQDPANTRIGDAFQQAKQSLTIANNEGLREVSDTFVLFGDPSALVIRP